MSDMYVEEPCTRDSIGMQRTSKKLCMKFCGNLAVGFSDSLKYLSTWDICFQKFNVS